jgi:hypothetical protein
MSALAKNSNQTKAKGAAAGEPCLNYKEDLKPHMYGPD